MNDKTFIPVSRMAHALGVSERWLRDEAEAGRVPHIRVGRRLMFNEQLVEQALLERAQANAREVQSDE